MGKTRSSAARSLAVVAFALSLFLARPNMGPVTTSTVSAAVPVGATSQMETQPPTKQTEPDVPQNNPYSDSSQCTYYAWDLAAAAGHKLPKFGNAKDWKEGATKRGYEVSEELGEASVDSLAVWKNGVGGTGWAGHVGWVTAVDGNKFLVKERNWTWQDSERWVEWEPGISFITFKKETPKQPPAADAPAPDSSRKDEHIRGDEPVLPETATGMGGQSPASLLRQPVSAILQLGSEQLLEFNPLATPILQAGSQPVEANSTPAPAP